jgi:hypothetical protein
VQSSDDPFVVGTMRSSVYVYGTLRRITTGEATADRPGIWRFRLTLDLNATLSYPTVEFFRLMVLNFTRIDCILTVDPIGAERHGIDNRVKNNTVTVLVVWNTE